MFGRSPLGKFKKNMDSAFRDNLGYKRRSSCSCEVIPLKSKVEKLKEKAEKYFKRFNRPYPIKPWEILYFRDMDCLHYGSKDGEEGVVLTVECFEQVKLGGKVGMIKEAYKRGKHDGIKARRQKKGLRGLSSLIHKDIKEIIKSPMKVNVASCHVYGERWGVPEERKEKIDFECPQNKNLKDALKISHVIRSVNAEEIMERLFTYSPQ